MNLKQAITHLDKAAPNPSEGLPDDIFYYISRTTPLVNVDLLIKNSEKGTLLSWRDDPYSGQGWHIPGGIIRHKETIIQRIDKVALSEIGVSVVCDSSPISINEIIDKNQQNRSHFISMLFACYLKNELDLSKQTTLEHDVGHLRWFKKAPKDLLSWHEIYRTYIDANQPY